MGVSEKLITDTTLLRTTCAEPRLAAEKQPGADDVDGHERERHRHAEQQQHGRAAEKQQRCHLPGHGHLPCSGRASRWTRQRRS